MLSRQANPPSVHQALIVDDSALMRMLLASLLKQRGFAVTEYNSAEGALQRLAGSGAPPDLLMLDIVMPRMSGIELCHIIRHELGLIELPVVAYTAHDDPATVAHMRMAGFNDFLFKPFNERALDGILEEVIVHH